MIALLTLLVLCSIGNCELDYGSASSSASGSAYNIIEHVNTEIIRNLHLNVYTSIIYWRPPIDYPNTRYYIRVISLQSGNVICSQRNYISTNFWCLFGNNYRDYKIVVIPDQGMRDFIIVTLNRGTPYILTSTYSLSRNPNRVESYWVPRNYSERIVVGVDVNYIDQFEFTIDGVSLAEINGSNDDINRCTENNGLVRGPYCYHRYHHYANMATYELWISNIQSAVNIKCHMWSLGRRSQTLKSCPTLNIYIRDSIPGVSFIKYNNVISWGPPIGILPSIQLNYEITVWHIYFSRNLVYFTKNTYFNMTHPEIPCDLTYGVVVRGNYNNIRGSHRHLTGIKPICGEFITPTMQVIIVNHTEIINNTIVLNNTEYQTIIKIVNNTEYIHSNAMSVHESVIVIMVAMFLVMCIITPVIVFN